MCREVGIKEGKKREISVIVDHSKSVMDLLVEATESFYNQLLDGCPRTYYVKVEVGNNHPEVITIPGVKTFRGDGEPLKV